jgi:hypothetical protein
MEIKKTLRAAITISAVYIENRPRLKSFLLSKLALFPKFRARLRRATWSPNTSMMIFRKGALINNMPTYFSPRAKKIYIILKQNIENDGRK